MHDKSIICSAFYFPVLCFCDVPNVWLSPQLPECQPSAQHELAPRKEHTQKTSTSYDPK